MCQKFGVVKVIFFSNSFIKILKPKFDKTYIFDLFSCNFWPESDFYSN